VTAAVRAQRLAAGYDGHPAVRDVSFELPPGRTLCVLGPNGGGKTTLFRALIGELPALAGERLIAGRPAYVAQSERLRLDFPVSALEVALMGSLPNGRWWLPTRRGDRDAAQRALARVGLEPEAGTRFGTLSGGQRQRTLLARALVQDAAVLLLDEPLAGVDPTSAERIAGLFGELRAEGRTLLVSTHDVQSARHFDLVLCLNRRQVAFGPPGEVLDREVLEATYAGAIIEIPGSDHVGVLPAHHH
jgi:manganese/iron transport system ATP-binding protein/manganese/zinc/iron transport system ATP- binding protein